MEGQSSRIGFSRDTEGGALQAGEGLSLLSFWPSQTGFGAKEGKDGGWGEMIGRAAGVVERFINPASAFDDRTPRQRSEQFQKDAETRLKSPQKGEVLTSDGKPPTEIEHKSHTLDAEQSVRDLVTGLGKNFSPAQAELYERIFMMQNHLAGKPDEVKIAAGTTVQLPGQTAEGVVFVVGDRPVVRKEYRQNDVFLFSYGGGVEGRAQYKDTNGDSVTVEWNHRFPDGNSRTSESAAQRRVEFCTGQVRNLRLQDGKWQKSQFEFTTLGGMRSVEYYNPGEEYAHSIKLTYRDGSVALLKLDNTAKSAEYIGRRVAADGKVVDPALNMDVWGNIFKVTTSVDAVSGRRLTTKTALDGATAQTEDEWHNVVSRTGVDPHARKIEEWFDPSGKVERTKIWPKDQPEAIELKRVSGGALRGEWIKDGKKVGSVAVGLRGEFIFTNTADRFVRMEFVDGSARETRALPDGGREVVEIPKAGPRRTTSFDWQGTMTKESRLYADKRCVDKEYADGHVRQFHLTETSGYKTTLLYNDVNQRYEGTRRPPVGAAVDNVVYVAGKLLYQAKADGSMRMEVYDLSSGEPFGAAAKKGAYDPDLATMSVAGAGGEVTTEALSGSRSDKVTTDKDGAKTIVGTTVLGETSSIKSNGETTIEYRGGSGVSLAADGKSVETWDAAKDKKKTELREFEVKFAGDNPAIDRRDLVQLHLNFSGDGKALQQFYEQLQRINGCDKLNELQKTALKRNLMHHVAYPSEIAQLDTLTCNVAVLQRDLAMTDPRRYAELVVDAFAKGEITTAQGKKVPIDSDNLKKPDTSGRDLATRTIAGIGYTALYYPHMQYQNGPDGAITYYRMPRREGDRSELRAGIFMGEIAEINYRLSGKDTAIVLINNESDLVNAFKLNDRKPMVLNVDGNKRPVSDVGGAAVNSHVLTVTDISGTPARVRFQNQWGLQTDHSRDWNDVRASELLSTTKLLAGRNEGLAQWHGQALVKGDRRRAYRFDGDKLVVDEAFTRIVTGQRQAIRD